VPTLNVSRPQFLEWFLPDVRHDLIGEQFMISLGGPCRYFLERFPLRNASGDMFANCQPRSGDV
jgi:hypothetical protein